MFAARLERVRRRMAELEVDALCCSVGADLPWLTGYTAMPLERLTMLVVPREGDAVLVVPALEAPRVVPRPEFTVRPWAENEDPIALVADHLRGMATIAIDDRTWARFVLALQGALLDTRVIPGNDVTAALRAVKDDQEIAALQRAASGIDEVMAAVRHMRFTGRSEADLAREIADHILAVGHERVNFVIVAAGPNAASPHHEPGAREIEAGDPVLIDIGGTMNGYCSDITRMFAVGDASERVRDAYEVLVEAEEAGVQAGMVGQPCETVDRAAREIIERAGFGEYFVHRTGHGIGVEEHEDPYMVAGNTSPIVAGNAFSVEPGIYVPGEFGMRLEDIVVATLDGPQRLNASPRDLAVVE